MADLCPCGQELHYTDPDIEDAMRRLVDRKGPEITVHTDLGVWMVPRHYIALHGLIPDQVPDLAEQFGWERVA